MKRFVCFLVIAFLSAGCASMEEREKNAKLYLDKSVDALKVLPVCCGSLGQSNFIKMERAEHRQFNVTQNDQAFDFDTGKSFFKAFILPSYEEDSYTLRLFSHYDNGTIFEPILMFLDENYNVVRYTGKSYRYVYIDKISKIYEMDDAMRIAKYLIVYTSPKFIGRRIALRGGGGGYAYATSVGITYVPGSNACRKNLSSECGRGFSFAAGNGRG